MDNNVYFEKNGYVFNYRVGAVIKKDEFTHYINVDESAKTLK